MNLELEPRGDVVVARIQDGRFVAGDAEDFKRKMAEAGKRIVLDLGEVKFMDSGALGAVLGVLKSVQPAGDLRLASVQAPVRAVFRLTRLDKVLAIDPDVEASVAAFGKAAS